MKSHPNLWTKVATGHRFVNRQTDGRSAGRNDRREYPSASMAAKGINGTDRNDGPTYQSFPLYNIWFYVTKNRSYQTEWWEYAWAHWRTIRKVSTKQKLLLILLTKLMYFEKNIRVGYRRICGKVVSTLTHKNATSNLIDNMLIWWWFEMILIYLVFSYMIRFGLFIDKLRLCVHCQTIQTTNTTYTNDYFWTYFFLTQIESTKKDSANTFVDMTSVWLAYNEVFLADLSKHSKAVQMIPHQIT